MNKSSWLMRGMKNKLLAFYNGETYIVLEYVGYKRRMNHACNFTKKINTIKIVSSSSLKKSN